MSIITKIFSGGAKDVINSVGGVLDNLITNKEELAKAKLELEKEVNRHFEVLQAIAAKETELQYQDKAGSRAREVDYVKATGHADWMQVIVGVLIMGSFFASVILIGFRAIPAGNEHIMINAIGILEGLVLSVSSYYFGSSLGSKIKDIRKNEKQ